MPLVNKPELTLWPLAQWQSFLAEQRKLSGDGTQKLAKTRRMAPCRFKLKAKVTAIGRSPAKN
jgi:hypothetical protein